jgi:hypothetical protein
VFQSKKSLGSNDSNSNSQGGLKKDEALRDLNISPIATEKLMMERVNDDFDRSRKE